jgi:hypothetical protein
MEMMHQMTQEIMAETEVIIMEEIPHVIPRIQTSAYHPPLQT